jgi:hypothetical protein
VLNPDGTAGRVRRQCTGIYKIEPVEQRIREIVGLRPRQRPASIVVHQWLGISSDEGQRASYPGRWRRVRAARQGDLFGGSAQDIRRMTWVPCRWKTHTYPLLNLRLLPDRRSQEVPFVPAMMSREDCLAWLERRYPGREFPRSACIGCPFRSNSEWRRMRDEDPEAFADAVDFDRALRAADQVGLAAKRLSVGTVYLHRQMVPLDEADLDAVDRAESAGCGTLFDESCGGHCGA